MYNREVHTRGVGAWREPQITRYKSSVINEQIKDIPKLISFFQIWFIPKYIIDQLLVKTENRKKNYLEFMI
jgi:hypothetical protein